MPVIEKTEIDPQFLPVNDRLKIRMLAVKTAFAKAGYINEYTRHYLQRFPEDTVLKTRLNQVWGLQVANERIISNFEKIAAEL